MVLKGEQKIGRRDDGEPNGRLLGECPGQVHAAAWTLLHCAMGLAKLCISAWVNSVGKMLVPWGSGIAW